VVAYKWLAEVFEPTIAAVPTELSAKLEPAEVFHQVLEHRWFMSEKAGRDVGLSEAIESYVADVLPHQPDERNVMSEVTDPSAEIPILDDPPPPSSDDPPPER
jgi:hypothetical protein